MTNKPSELSLDYLLDSLADRLATRIGERTTDSLRPRLLNVNQAEYLNRSSHSVRHLVSIGKLRVVKLDGRIFLDVRDLDQAIEDAKTC